MKNVKDIQLTKEEKEIMHADEQGLLKPLPNLEEEKERAAKIARNTLKKNKAITIRLAERDLMKLKAKAIEEGIPYQTLITSILHKHIY